MRDIGGTTVAPMKPELPPVIGHRGAGACAPENTLAGIAAGHALGCRWVEFDVRLTADGELDPAARRQRWNERPTARGRARRLPLAAIRRLDAGKWFDPAFAGERVPTLGEAIAVLAELGLGANIELKAERGCAAETGIAAADLLVRLWPPQLPAPLISSFVAGAVRGGARPRPGDRARPLGSRGVPADWRRRAAALAARTVHADHRLLRPGIVAEIRRAGYSVLRLYRQRCRRARANCSNGGSLPCSRMFPDMILAAMPGDLGPPGVSAGFAATPRTEALS